jgi:hypothetical protein
LSFETLVAKYREDSILTVYNDGLSGRNTHSVELYENKNGGIFYTLCAAVAL